MGRFTFKTHKIVNEEGIKFDTSKDIFKVQRYLEWYETEGFYEVAFSLVKDESYRRSAKKLNRVRREEVGGGTPTRTLASIVEIESKKMTAEINGKTAEILAENNFTEEGLPKDLEKEYGRNIKNSAIKKEDKKEAQEKYNKSEAEEGFKISDSQREKTYIDPKEAVKISIDDIVEKANDLIVSERQKHNGMSWSNCGSIGLATITALNLNKELHRWITQGKIDFKLVS